MRPMNDSSETVIVDSEEQSRAEQNLPLVVCEKVIVELQTLAYIPVARSINQSEKNIPIGCCQRLLHI